MYAFNILKRIYPVAPESIWALKPHLQCLNVSVFDFKNQLPIYFKDSTFLHAKLCTKRSLLQICWQMSIYLFWISWNDVHTF